MYHIYVRECLWKYCIHKDKQIFRYHPFDVPALHDDCADLMKDYYKRPENQ